MKIINRRQNNYSKYSFTNNTNVNENSKDYKIYTNNVNSITKGIKIYSNNLNGISKGNKDIYLTGRDINDVSKSININNMPEIHPRRKNYTYISNPPQIKENFIPNHTFISSISSKYKSKTNLNNNNNHEYEVNEEPKESEVLHANNIVVDISKDGKVSEKIFSSSIRRISNFKKNLLNNAPKNECELCHKLIETHLYIVHINSHATEVFKWLFLGTFDNACDIQELRRIKATHVLNCAVECTNTSLPKDIKELHLKIHDYEGFELFDYFERANDFMNKCKMEGGAVLVHCKYGVSRSVAFVIAYLIKYMKFTADSALKFLMTKRNQIKPNEGFMEQLNKYQIWIKRKK
jgi:protein-tyrosine phosphatase